MNIKELQSKKLAELKELAKTLGLTGVDKLKKADLIAKIAASDEAQPKPEPPKEETGKRKRTRKRIIVEDNKDQPSLFEEKEKVGSNKAEDTPKEEKSISIEK